MVEFDKTAIRLYFLGTPRATDSVANKIELHGKKCTALLAYFVASAPRVHARDTIAALFWPDLPDKDARNNLRVALTRIRKIPGQQDAPVITANRHTISLNPESPVWSDISEFEKLESIALESGAHAGVWQDSVFQSIARAVDLYQGEFLSGLHMEGCEEFDQWLHDKREHYRVTVIKLLEQTALMQQNAGQLSLAERTTRRLLSLDSLQESAHRTLIQLLAQQEKRHAAYAHFEFAKKLLHDELGVLPDVKTTALMNAIGVSESPRLDINSCDLAALTMPFGSNLPIDVSPYVGNESVVNELVEQLNNRRFITLTGIGGIGKTRLARQVARTVHNRFHDGVWFISLSTLNTRTDLTDGLCHSPGIDIDPGVEAVECFTRQLKGRELLLILDDVEATKDDLWFIQQLLSNTAGLSLLITSRQRLDLASEAVFPVSGLSYANGNFLNDPKVDTSSDASGLFIETACQLKLGATFDDHECAAIAGICQLVEGHPLAIVLAARWTQSLSCADIFQELQNGFGILETDASDVPARQRSVHAVFNSSWNTLTEEEQILLADLSVFEGGFDRHAAAEVTGAGLGQLNSLCGKSLVQYSRDHGRYRLHELMRQCAEAHLHASVRYAAIINAHAQHYLAHLSRYAASPPDKSSTLALDINVRNIRKACMQLLATHSIAERNDAARGLKNILTVIDVNHGLFSLLPQLLPVIEHPERDSEAPVLIH